MTAVEQQAATSFGDPNAEPPTPDRTPSPSPLLQVQTPKQDSGHFDESSGWTPRFAEEYSVFNTTPGNLRSNPGIYSNHEFAPLSPVPLSAGKKRPLSSDGLNALGPATINASHSPDPSSHPPAEPARQLPSSPSLVNPASKDAVADANVTPTQSHVQQQQQQSQEKSKKPRRGLTSAAAAREAPSRTQTATPPPSSRGGRKLAPKFDTVNMQYQGFGQPIFSNAPASQQQQQQQKLNTTFVTGNPEDVFGYPMGPATAPPVAGRQFWGVDIDPSGMSIDVDLSNGADLWAGANQMHQNSVPVQALQEQQQLRGQDIQQKQPPRRERPIAPKTTAISTPSVTQTSPSQHFDFAGSFQMPLENPFSQSPGGVDPGLLFNQPVSSMQSGAMSMSMDTTARRPTSSAPGNLAPSTTNSMNMEQGIAPASMSTGNDTRPLAKQADNQRKPLADRIPAAMSPTKSTGRPNLSRSFSEGGRGGKRTVGRRRQQPLSILAPAKPVTLQQQPSLPPPTVNHHHNNSNRPQSGGRISPLKSSHHHRLSSLSSIPENAFNASARARTAKRTSVKFVIDENGRARSETVSKDDDDDPELNERPTSQGSSAPAIPTQASDDENSSSSDDEPIIIPSRNTSFDFSMPPSTSSLVSRRPTATGNLSLSAMRPRSFTERPSSTSSSFLRLSQVDRPGVVDQPERSQRPSTGGSLGDAAAELRKVMQAGGFAPGQQQQQLMGGRSCSGSGSGSGNRHRFTPGQRSSSFTVSDASLSGTSPPFNRDQNQGQPIRCVCNRPEADVDGSRFLVKCDSCDFLLHGRCIDVPAPQDLPHVYICAFCANMRSSGSGRMRRPYTGRGGGGDAADDTVAVGAAGTEPAAAIASSPMAHKSFRSFR